MVICMADDDNTNRDSNNNYDVVLIHYTPSRPPPLPEPPPSFIDSNFNNDSILHCDDPYGCCTNNEHGEKLLFRSIYQVKYENQILLLSLQVQVIIKSRSMNQVEVIKYDDDDIAIMQQVVLYCYQDKNIDNNNNNIV